MTVARKVGEIVSNKTDTKNIYKSKQNYIDRNSKSVDFPEFELKSSKISTVLLLLESEEDEVVEKALYHIDKFASIGKQQLYALEENRIYEFALKLIKSENVIVKKFTFKLLVQLIHNIDDCRKKLLNDDVLIKETKNIFIISSDDNLVEFSCILLHYVCSDLRLVHTLTQDNAFVSAIFTRLKSFDLDIQLQSIQLLNLIMNNSMLITEILSMNEFPLKSLQIELKNDCREIRVAALESFQIISSLREQPFKDEFVSDLIIEAIHEICMSDDTKLQKLALKTLKNICSDERALVKVSQHLPKYLQQFLIDEPTTENQDVFLKILTSLASLEDNLRIMHENGFIKKVIKMVKENASLAACDALIVMSKNVSCLEEILRENIYEILLELLTEENRYDILSAFHSLINLQGLNHLLEVTSSLSKVFVEILKESSSAPLKVKVIAILEKLATYSSLKSKLSQIRELSKEIFYCLLYSSYSTKLIVRLFLLIANYIDQESFRAAFIEFNASELIEIYLSSQVTQVRASVCTLISQSTNFPQLASHLIDNGVLRALQLCDFESDCFDSLLSTNVAVKFAVLRRLEASDRIESGFYAVKSNKMDWQVQREIMKSDLQSPICVFYTINFNDDENCFDRKIPIDDKLKQLKSSIACDENFKNSDEPQKLKILAEKVSKFFKADENQEFYSHLTELKSQFESSVIPLGSLIYAESFEAALMFKALADQFKLDISFVTDDINGGKAWNEWNETGGVVDLFFDVGEIYGVDSKAGRKYFESIL